MGNWASADLSHPDCVGWATDKIMHDFTYHWALLVGVDAGEDTGDVDCWEATGVRVDPSGSSADHILYVLSALDNYVQSGNQHNEGGQAHYDGPVGKRSVS